MLIYLVFGMHPTIPAAGGVRPYVQGLAKGLAARGHDVTVMGAGPTAHVEFCDFISVTPQYPLSEYTFIRSLWHWLRGQHLPPEAIVHGQRPDELYPFARLSKGNPLVCTLHGDPARGVAQRRKFGRLAYAFAEREALKASRHVVAVSRKDLGIYVRHYPWLQAKSSVIPVGVDLNVFHPADHQQAKQSLGLGAQMTLLFAGRLEPEKNVGTIVETVRMMPKPPSLLVAGEGRLGQRLRRAATGLQVRFLGTVEHSKMPALYAAADALVLPSAYEGMPTVALESLACGTPVITTRVGEMVHLISESKTGYFFDGSPAGLARVLDEQGGTLGGLRPLCAELGRTFGWESVVDLIVKVYNNLS